MLIILSTGSGASNKPSQKAETVTTSGLRRMTDQSMHPYGQDLTMQREKFCHQVMAHGPFRVMRCKKVITHRSGTQADLANTSQLPTQTHIYALLRARTLHCQPCHHQQQKLHIQNNRTIILARRPIRLWPHPSRYLADCKPLGRLIDSLTQRRVLQFYNTC